jgi:hypothetical protein
MCLSVVGGGAGIENFICQCLAVDTLAIDEWQNSGT